MSSTTKEAGLLENGKYWDESASEAKASHTSRAIKWLGDVTRSVVNMGPEGEQKQLRRTAYLDGLRGFAAFIVYLHHHELWTHEQDHILENGFGSGGKFYFAALPGIRNFFTGGHYAVTTFFVISGYALSSKPLALIQSGEYNKLGENLGSALFRRWLRLYIPVIVTTFLYMTSWYAFGIWTHDERQKSYGAELWKWYSSLKNFSFVFQTSGEMFFPYNFHVWSIPVEFRGSIVIYTATLAFSRCTRNARLLCEVGLIAYFLYIVDGWYCALFTAGMLICDLDLLAQNNDLPSVFSKLKPHKQTIFYCLFAISTFFGGVPSVNSDIKHLRSTPLWGWLSYFNPQAVFDYKWFFLFWAASFLVASIPRIPWLKAFFESRFNQNLGRISYSLYLVHGPVIWIVADRLYSAVGFARPKAIKGIPGWVNLLPLPKTGIYGLEIAFLLPHLILLPLTLWVAEVVTRLLDEPSVDFARWLHTLTLPPPTK